MTQANPIIGSGKTGIEYRTADNDGKQALLNHHKGGSAPSYKEAGTVWLDDSATPWKLKMYDGADWITLMAVNAAANTVTPYLGGAALGLVNFATDTGSANAYAVAPSPAIAAYAAGQMVVLKPAHANTGASTIAVSGLSAAAIKMPDGSALPAGVLATTGAFLLFYDGTNFVLLNGASAGEGVYWAIDEQSTSVSPDSAGLGAWTKRGLNTEKKNTVTGASQSAGTITLPAGTYEVDAGLVIYNAHASVQASATVRLRDTTNGVTLALGFASGITMQTGFVPAIKAVFTLTGTANVELQYFCPAVGTPKLGFGMSTPENNVWASVYLKRKA